MVFKKPSLITPHSIFITHHSIIHHLSLKIPQLPKMVCLALVSNFNNSKNFTYYGTHRLTWCTFYFLFLFSFFFLSSTPNTQTHQTQWRKKKKKIVKLDLTTYMQWVPQICAYLPKCHQNSVSITQKHLKVVFSFNNSSLKN